MNKSDYILATVGGMILSLMVWGCHTSKQSTSTPEETVVSTTVTNPMESRYDAMISNYGDWKSVKVPINLNIKSPMELSIGGTATMERGRYIHMSFRFLGIEVCNLFITNDSVCGSYKLKKLYFAESTQELLGKFPVNVNNVQDLLLGRPFIAGDQNLSKDDFSKITLVSGQGGAISIRPPQIGDIDYSFNISKANRCQSLVVMPTGRDAVICTYSDDVKTIAGYVASEASISTKVGKETVKVSLALNPRKADWNKLKESARWKAPKGYTRVMAKALLNSFSGF